MKKIIVCLLGVLLLTGCVFNTDDFSDKYTYTTIYPVEYITSYLYGNYSNVTSIYPNDCDIETYELTDKQISKYASGSKFIYTLANEVMTAVDIVNKNKNIQVIHASKGMSFKNGQEELWMDPSNYLMMALNIKNGLLEYETAVYNEKDINAAYGELKEKISELDVSYTLLGKNGKYNTLLVANNMFKYLEKYSINVLSIDSTNEDNTKAYTEANKLIADGAIKYLYKIKGTILDEKIQKFVDEKQLEVVDIDTAINLSESQRTNGDDYLSIANNNIEQLKKELFK